MIRTEPDRISHGEQHFPLLCHPLEDHFRATGKPSPYGYFLGHDWLRGYVASWRIENGRLHLTDVSLDPVLEGRRLGIVDVFPHLSPPIEASWFSGTLRIGHGNILKDDLDSPVYEQEDNVRVQGGRIISSEIVDGFTVLSRQHQESGAEWRRTALRYARITVVIALLVAAGAFTHLPRLILAALMLLGAATAGVALFALRAGTGSLRDAEWYWSRRDEQGPGFGRPVPDPPSRESWLESGAWLVAPGIVLLAFAFFAHTESSNVTSVTLVYVLNFIAFVFGLTGLSLGVAGCQEMWEAFGRRDRGRLT